MTGSPFAAFDRSNFDAEVLAQRGLVLVDFWSEACAPCKQLSRLLGQLSEEIPAGVRIGTVNADDNPSLIDRFDVRGLPTLLFFKDGIVVARRTGVDRRQVLKKLVETHA
ncbi:MAG: thioredoxin family protein [Xanthobacteraceae bacterium]